MTGTITTKFEGLDDLTRRLRAAGAATRSVFREAAQAGGEVIQRHANANAPGPHIGIEVKAENAERAVASVGPKKEKWFYRFREFGTKDHGPKHKKTRFQSYLRRVGANVSDKRVSMLRWYQNGQPIFARRVRGVSAKPFLQPAMQRTEEIVEAVGEVYLRAITEKSG
jgi:HK97 gp10 family phage protein